MKKASLHHFQLKVGRSKGRAKLKYSCSVKIDLIVRVNEKATDKKIPKMVAHVIIKNILLLSRTRSGLATSREDWTLMLITRRIFVRRSRCL